MQPGFWDIATYVYDSISVVNFITTIVASIGTLASASGLGWLAALVIPADGGLVQSLLAIHADNLVGQTMKEKYLGAISTFIATAMGAAGIMVGSGQVTAAGITTGIVAFIMIILEILRVQWLDRETIYGLVKRKYKECRGGENAQLLPN